MTMELKNNKKQDILQKLIRYFDLKYDPETKAYLDDFKTMAISLHPNPKLPLEKYCEWAGGQGLPYWEVDWYNLWGYSPNINPAPSVFSDGSHFRDIEKLLDIKIEPESKLLFIHKESKSEKNPMSILLQLEGLFIYVTPCEYEKGG